jgi:hypothetical protein
VTIRQYAEEEGEFDESSNVIPYFLITDLVMSRCTTMIGCTSRDFLMVYIKKKFKKIELIK